MANWIFYAMLMEVCHQIAVPRNQTIERISGEMVWRTFYHFSPALKRGQARELVSYLVEHHQWLGLVKAVRVRHRERDNIKLTPMVSTTPV